MILFTTPSSTQPCSKPPTPRDPDDPTPDPHEWRVYADDREQIYAVVDEIDWHWAIQWRWSWKKSKRSKKLYLRRTSTERNGPDQRADSNVYLHIEILKRKGDPPETPKHIIADHINRDSLYCRRENLRWLTEKESQVNRVTHNVRNRLTGRFA